MDEQKKTKLIPVRVVSTTGKSALVEWQEKDGLHRASLPADKIGEKVDQELLDAAVPYGVPWADMPFKQFTGEQFQNAMYQADLWTDEQVRNNAQKVIGVLQTLYMLHLGTIAEYADKFKQ
jgi:hypothetical protein